MSSIEIDYEKHLENYKELLFGTDFDSKKNKNRVRLFYYKLILRNILHFIRSVAVSFPHIIRIVINVTREMDFGTFGDYIGLNFYIVDMMRKRQRENITNKTTHE
ncbi:MAG: hypothetical protein EU549_00365 [Promethearchaeota archaeon]|nr:MAG: hypothetical protein EU549_00365 [Candidatus Lokiarchaeota archaeon]